ncbi:MAG: hypothetical protein ABSA03_14840 [Streptosporangiaceae bacterium]|jgi:hypothetical protein
MRWWDDDPWRYLDGERADDPRRDPPWLHPDCVDACTALSFGACCRLPVSSLARQLGEVATALEQAAAGAQLDADDEFTAARFMGGLAQADALLGQIPDRPVSAREAELFQLSCLAGRIAGCLEDVRRQQEPADSPAARRRRIDIGRVTVLAAERSQRLWELAVCRLRGAPLAPASTCHPEPGAGQRVTRPQAW